MKKLKYIIVEHGAILFGDTIDHSTAAGNKVVKSAGFVSITYNEITYRYDANCYGESATLKVKSNPAEDKKSIEYAINEY